MSKRKKRKSAAATARKSAGRYKERSYLMDDGRKKPSTGPSKVLLAQRKALASDPTQATNPMDCAFANGWIEEKDHRTGAYYAETYRRCGFRLGSTTASASCEVDFESELTKLSLAQLPDTVIVAAWDRVMAVRSGEGGDGALLETWSRIHRPLSAPQRQQLFLVCVMESWPQWLLQRHGGKTYEAKVNALAKKEKRELTKDEADHIHKRMNSHWERSRAHLIEGLAAIRAELSPSLKITIPPIQSVATPRPRTPRHMKRTERTTYVDPDGEIIREVTVRRRIVEQA